MYSNISKYTTIENDFIRQLATKRLNRLKLKWSLSKVSDFLRQDQIIVNRLTTLVDRVCHSIDRYELVDGSQIIQTEIETFNVRLYDDSSFLINMLKTVGFREIRMMNPFDKKSAPNIDATDVVYECRK